MVGNSLAKRELPIFFNTNNLHITHHHLLLNRFTDILQEIDSQYTHLFKGQHNFLSFCVTHEYYDLLYLFIQTNPYTHNLYVNEESLSSYICSTQSRKLIAIEWEIKIIKLIFNQNKQYAYHKGRHGFSILHYTIINKPYYFNKEIINTLQEHDINLNTIAFDDSNRTPLFYVFVNPQTALQEKTIIQEYINFVRMIKLYSKITDLSSKDINNDTILSYAINYNCTFEKTYLMIECNIPIILHNHSKKYYQYLSYFEKRKLRNKKINIIGTAPLYLQ